MLARRLVAFLAGVPLVLTGLVTLGLQQPASAAGGTTMTHVAGGGVGDGGPGLEAYIRPNASVRTADGDILFFDGTTKQIRRWDSGTGIVDVQYGVEHGDQPDTGDIDGQDARNVELPGISRMWLRDNDTHLWFMAGEWDLYRLDLTTHIVNLEFDSLGGFGYTRAVDVRPDESLVVVRYQYVAGTPSGWIELAPPGADRDTPRTIWATFAEDPAGSFASAADGTVYHARGGGIWRMTGAGTRVLVAGVDSWAGSWEQRTDPATALGGAMAPTDLLVAPNGDVLFRDDYNSAPSVRRVVVGGQVSTVVNRSFRPFAVDGSHVYGADGGIRRWDADGSDKDAGGTRLVGTATGYVASSPSGTPIEDAILGEITGLTFRPNGEPVIATLDAVLTITGPPGSQVLQHLAGVTGPPASSAVSPLEVAASNGAVYILDDLSASHSTWPTGPLVIRRVATDGTVTTIAGGGTGELTDGAAGSSPRLRQGSLALSADGSTLYLAQPRKDTMCCDGSVWALDLSDNTWHLAAGGGSVWPTDGAEAVGTALGDPPALLGVVDGDLVISAGATYRLGDDGKLHVLNNGEYGTAVSPDGALWSPGPASLMRVGLDGSVALAAGKYADGSGHLGGPQPGTGVGAPDGSVWWVDRSGYTASLERLTVTPQAWPGAGPDIEFTADTKLHVSVTKAATPWPVRVDLLAQLDSGQKLQWGASSNYSHLDLPAEAGTTELDLGPAQAGHQYVLGAWVRSDRATIALPRIEKRTSASPGKPRAPIGVYATPGNHSATVHWEPADDGGSPITSYTVTRADNNETCTWTSGPLECTFTGLTNWSGYSFYVTATNAHGTSGSSSEAWCGYPHSTSSRLTLTTGSGTVVAGQSLTLKGKLDDGIEAITGQDVQLQRRATSAQAWSTFTTTTTDVAGTFVLVHKPTRTYQYRATFVGGWRNPGTTSVARSVTVSAKATLGLSRSTVKKGKAVRFSGVVAPAVSGDRVLIQRRVSGTWRTVATVRAGNDGRYTYAHKPKSRRDYTWRAYVPATSAHLSGASPTRKLIVK